MERSSAQKSHSQIREMQSKCLGYRRKCANSNGRNRFVVIFQSRKRCRTRNVVGTSAHNGMPFEPCCFVAIFITKYSVFVFFFSSEAACSCNRSFISLSRIFYRCGGCMLFGRTAGCFPRECFFMYIYYMDVFARVYVN